MLLRLTEWLTFHDEMLGIVSTEHHTNTHKHVSLLEWPFRSWEWAATQSEADVSDLYTDFFSPLGASGSPQRGEGY